jgi:hypothetical protein
MLHALIVTFLYSMPSTALTVASSPLTPSQPDSLPILLQLGDQRVALLDHVGILLILVVRAIGLNDVINPVNGTGDTVGGYKFGEITEFQSASKVIIREGGRYRSRKSTEIPKAFAMLSSPTIR